MAELSKKEAGKTLAKKSTTAAAKSQAAAKLAAEPTTTEKVTKTAKTVAEKAPRAVKQAAINVAETELNVGEHANAVTEVVADGAEAVAEGFTHVAEVSRALTPRQVAIVATAVVVGVAAGGFVGYRFAEKRLSTKFDQLLEEETTNLKAYYAQKVQAKEEQLGKGDLQARVEELGYTPQGEAITAVQATPASIMKAAKENQEALEAAEREREAVASPEPEPVNVFEQRDAAEAAIRADAIPEWDYAVEMKARDPRVPYVIHVDEFRENLHEHAQVDLTFYEGDEVLAGDNDTVVQDMDEAIGADNLHRFGHGSGDPHTVFVRNMVREIDYEIARSNGRYAQDVLGFSDEQLSHSDQSHRKHRSRFTDE